VATPKDANDITRLLIEGRAGDLQSRDQAISLLYDNLHQIARQLLRRERGMLTLSAPELIHEVFFRLFGKNEPDWESRRHQPGVPRRRRAGPEPDRPLRQRRTPDHRRRRALVEHLQARRVDHRADPAGALAAQRRRRVRRVRRRLRRRAGPGLPHAGVRLARTRRDPAAGPRSHRPGDRRAQRQPRPVRRLRLPGRRRLQGPQPRRGNALSVVMPGQGGVQGRTKPWPPCSTAWITPRLSAPPR
jgi:hypothetical protein